MTSGAWFRARPVMEACAFAMQRLVAEWQHKRTESICLRMARGRWSWRKFRDVPLTYAEAEAENNVYCRVLTDQIENPMEHAGYASMQELFSLAAEGENILAGAQVYVSAEDHWRISSALQMVEVNGAGVECSVPDAGDRLQ